MGNILTTVPALEAGAAVDWRDHTDYVSRLALLEHLLLSGPLTPWGVVLDRSLFRVQIQLALYEAAKRDAPDAVLPEYGGKAGELSSKIHLLLGHHHYDHGERRGHEHLAGSAHGLSNCDRDRILDACRAIENIRDIPSRTLSKLINSFADIVKERATLTALSANFFVQLQEGTQTDAPTTRAYSSTVEGADKLVATECAIDMAGVRILANPGAADAEQMWRVEHNFTARDVLLTEVDPVAGMEAKTHRVLKGTPRVLTGKDLDVAWDLSVVDPLPPPPPPDETDEGGDDDATEQEEAT